jgi:phage shock protein PspC (stress-responsive transcriptional regulator)
VEKKPLEWKDRKEVEREAEEGSERKVARYRKTLERKIWGWIIFGAGVYFLIDYIRVWRISSGVVGNISLCYFVMWLGWWLARSKPKPKFECPICGFIEGEEE